MGIYKNASRTIVFSMVTTAGAADTSTSPTCSVAKDDGNFAACFSPAVRKTLSSAATNVFHLTLTADEMNADVVSVLVTGAGCIPINMIMLTEADYTSTKAGYIDTAISGRMASGNVTIGDYASGKDPGTYVLSTPANKLVTDGNGQVTVGTMAAAPLISIASAIWQSALSGMSTVGSIGKKLASWALGSDNKALLSTDAANASTIAGAVWDVTASTHNTAGTTGAKLNSASGSSLTASDIADAVWDEPLNEHGSTGTTGDAISGIQTTLIGATSEVGKVAWTHVVMKDGSPVEGATISYHSDAARTVLIPPSKTTNANGAATFLLDAGHYWVTVSIEGDVDRFGEEDVH